MIKITVVSGKGGVGKSSIAASMALVLSKNRDIVAVDCDVDAPNLGLLLGVKKEGFSYKEVGTKEKASLIEDRCIRCRKCVDICVFSAISWDNLPIFDKYLCEGCGACQRSASLTQIFIKYRCEGCGACQLVCPVDAIELIKVQNAFIGFTDTQYGFPVVGGQLKPGESGSGDVVTLVKEKAEEIANKRGIETMIIDSAAGIGCPVIASVTGSDYVVAVTEPTPAAFSDLKRVLEVVEHFNIPYGIIINTWNTNPAFTEKIEKFASENEITLLGKIPYDKAFIDALVQLMPVVAYDKRFKKLFKSILEKTLAEVEK